MVIMSKFAETLSALMAEQNLKAPALAKILNTNRSNVTRYLEGKRFPSYYNFIAIADYFSISTDVLLGRLDYTNDTTFLPALPFGTRLRQIMQETKTTQYRIELDLKISGANMYKWLNDITVPSVESLDKLADYMDISIDYLLGRIR